MLNIETAILTAICQKACTYEGDDQLSASEYLKQYGRVIKGTGRLLESLGLAELDEQSDLGSKPTARLVSIIAKQATRPLSNSKVAGTERDSVFFARMFSFADLKDEEAIYYGFDVLAALGLLRDCVDDMGRKPTRLLRQLHSYKKSLERASK